MPLRDPDDDDEEEDDDEPDEEPPVIENPTNRAKDLMSWGKPSFGATLIVAVLLGLLIAGYYYLIPYFTAATLVCVVCARKPPREGLAALAARNKAALPVHSEVLAPVCRHPPSTAAIFSTVRPETPR